MAAKPSIPKGTRDFSPVEVAKRQYIIQIIKTHFERFGYQPIETPSFENSETLMGKYGEEGDRLIFKILDSGDYFEKNIDRTLSIDIAKLSSEITQFFIEFFAILRDQVDETSDYNEISNYIENSAADIIRQFGKGEMFTYKHFLEENIINQKNTISISIVNRPEFFTSNNAFRHFQEIEMVTICGYATSYVSEKLYKSISSKKLTPYISEKALRYDLTVPFARYVVQNQNDIVFPFKRYQIQPVWRADRPQKGRFREFYQCDADVVGSTSLWQEVELVQLYDAVFSTLRLKGVTIKINNRKILSGIAEVIGAKDKLIDFTVALDKLDKIGEDGVKKEMMEKGIAETAIEKVQPLFQFTGSISEKIEKLSALLASSEEGKKGIEELRFICDNIQKLGLKDAILDLDVTLARGLNYYTGAIFEVAPPATVSMGSIGGGGRYDDLTGIFGLKDMSGVGISFGLDRIYLVIEELGLFPETVSSTSKALFINYGETEAFYAMQAMTQLREAGIKVELYPDAAKIGKQFTYADKRGIPYAVVVGETEMQNNQFGLKDLASGEQVMVDFEGLREGLL